MKKKNMNTYFCISFEFEIVHAGKEEEESTFNTHTKKIKFSQRDKSDFTIFQMAKNLKKIILLLLRLDWYVCEWLFNIIINTNIIIYSLNTKPS